MLDGSVELFPQRGAGRIIEEVREVQLPPHVVQLESRPADPQRRGAVSIRDLFRATLRMRPDGVIVGEILGNEALDIIQAMTSGHGGCMGTLHATHPHDTLTRLETMGMMSDVDMAFHAMRNQIGSGVQIIMQVSRLQDGSRKLTHISEVTGFDTVSGKYQVQDLFVREYDGFDEEQRVKSQLVPTGILPKCLDQLVEHGLTLPDAVMDRAKRRGVDVRL